MFAMSIEQRFAILSVEFAALTRIEFGTVSELATLSEFATVGVELATLRHVYPPADSFFWNHREVKAVCHAPPAEPQVLWNRAHFVVLTPRVGKGSRCAMVWKAPVAVVTPRVISRYC